MKKSKFKQLVSLYLDKEISKKELRELEDLVAADQKYLDLFNEYCVLYAAERKIFFEQAKILA